MARGVYMLATAVRLTGTFLVAGVATDPTTITATIKSPTGVVTSYVYLTDAALVRDSAGVYRVDVQSSVPGRWIYRFEGTGAADAAEEEIFIVEYSEV